MKTAAAAIARTERETALLQECRTRLTVDVRGATAKLPEPPPAAEETLGDLEEVETEEAEV